MAVKADQRVLDSLKAIKVGQMITEWVVNPLLGAPWLENSEAMATPDGQQSNDLAQLPTNGSQCTKWEKRQALCNSLLRTSYKTSVH